MPISVQNSTSTMLQGTAPKRKSSWHKAAKIIGVKKPELQRGDTFSDDDDTQSFTITRDKQHELTEEQYENHLKRKNSKAVPMSPQQSVYTRACTTLDLAPVSAFHRGLATDSVVVRNYVLGPQKTKACAIALVNSTEVTKLHLEANDIGVRGAEYLAEMLEQNKSITNLIITYNNIGREGLFSLSEVFRTNDRINKLDLSGNHLTDTEAEYIVNILDEGQTLKELRLNHNEFQEEGAIQIAEALGRNINLEMLDLSWNHIRRRGAVALANSLETNSGLLELDVSWNGFAQEGCQAFCKSLSENSTLTTLNLNCNRIGMPALQEILTIIRRNRALTTLKLSENPMTTDGALALIKALEETPESSVTHIDISSQTVSPAFAQSLERVQKLRSVEVLHGKTLDMGLDDDTIDATFDQEDPMTVLMEFMRLRNLRLIDLFHSLDADGSKSLTRREFKKGLMDVNIPLSARALDKLLDKLDTDGDGEVDFGEMIKGQKNHKTKLHRQKQKQSGDVPYENTELGRVSTKLRCLMTIRKRRSMSDLYQARKDEKLQDSLETVKETDNSPCDNKDSAGAESETQAKCVEQLTREEERDVL